MGARGEVIQTRAPWADLPNASAWLLGHVRTDVAGYRSAYIGADPIVIASGQYRFDEYLGEINDESLAAVGDDSAVWDPAGKGQFTNGMETVALDQSVDRLGWLIGSGVEAGVSATMVPRHIPPAGIPLIGAKWDRVEKDADRRVITDLYRRDQGYSWGAADIFECRLCMHRYSFEALQTGWCLRGKVTLGGASKLDDPWSVSDPAGAITGYVLGLGNVEWRGSRQDNVVVEMAIAVEG